MSYKLKFIDAYCSNNTMYMTKLITNTYKVRKPKSCTKQNNMMCR